MSTTADLAQAKAAMTERVMSMWFPSGGAAPVHHPLQSALDRMSIRPSQPAQAVQARRADWIERCVVGLERLRDLEDGIGVDAVAALLEMRGEVPVSAILERGCMLLKLLGPEGLWQVIDARRNGLAG